MDEEKQKCRVNSMRWESWDYGAAGAYFITTNCKHHTMWFGNVVDGEMGYNDCGKLAVSCWEEIPNHFHDVELGEFVIMPNHLHGIIHLTKDHLTLPGPYGMFETPAARRRGNQGANTISAIVGSFKSVVTKRIHLLEPNFAWQSRFHDRVIRSAKEYEAIANYILNNPANWKGDEYYRLP